MIPLWNLAEVLRTIGPARPLDSKVTGQPYVSSRQPPEGLCRATTITDVPGRMTNGLLRIPSEGCSVESGGEVGRAGTPGVGKI